MVKRTVFILVELLVVIAIIVMLAAMLLPLLRTAREKGQACGLHRESGPWGVAIRTSRGDANGGLMGAAVLNQNRSPSLVHMSDSSRAIVPLVNWYWGMNYS